LKILLAGIVCRNAEEKTTFLNLIKDKSNKLFFYWQSRIVGLSIPTFITIMDYLLTAVLFMTRDLSLSFSDSYPRKKYAGCAE
jgi:hypothetical protein